MPLSVRQLLEDKGVPVKEEHLETLNNRWKEMHALRGNLESANLDEANISLTNTPGGDHIE
ncbi:hypothetical protein CHL76_11645 [Marinococcus halophilus]|uniref:Uncharacterized protein n=1 Tax=Marinococcus halophilus TaxID=1371 RepID=A0A510YAF3_MARHA|nr:hypothetical protein [Marinococcus halophilus]OZT79565.1 hypothetical protein CHL76_11645 [Marinococcus halophilus]GEK60339.1 hypothetical protein MHA01_32440 [Marinococcus halophilus]